MKLIGGATVLAMVLALSACQKEVHLPGERLDPRDVMSDAASIPATAVQTARPISLPAQTHNADWPQRGGAASHLLVNPAIGAGTTRVWSVSIGQGDSQRYRIASEPVAGAGRIYTMDSRARLTATGTNGATLWQTDIAAPGDRADDATGAGLAYDGGRVYATTGFSELVALDAATGKVLWRQRFDAGVGGAPTVSNGIVYVVARDASAWAIRAEDGKVLWQLAGTPAPGMTGVSAPAANDRLVVFPFATGEMIATLKKGGLTLWQAKVAGARLGRGYAVVSDLTGDPVIAGETLYAGSSAGKVAAFDVNSGERIWTATEGANSPVQLAGGSLFLVSDEGKLVRLDAGTGEVIWKIDLPYYTRDKIKKQREITVNLGPVLAGGKLFVASSDGLLRVFDPASGSLIGQADIPGGAATDPIVAGGTLYVVGRNGQLHAFR